MLYLFSLTDSYSPLLKDKDESVFCLYTSEGPLCAHRYPGRVVMCNKQQGPFWQRSQCKDANHAEHVLGDSDLIFRDELRLFPSKIFTMAAL